MLSSLLKCKDFKYVIFDPSYISRLFKKVKIIKDEMKNKGLSGTDLLYIYDDKLYRGGIKPPKRGYSNKDVSCLFDPMIDEAPDVKSIQYVYDKTKKNDGIAFKCDSMDKLAIIADILFEQEHCAWFNFDNLSDMKQIDDVLILKFDTESG